MSKIIIYDPVSQIGHIEFNEYFLKNYNWREIKCANIRGFWRKAKIFYHIKSLINHFRLVRDAEKGSVFLYFENTSLFLLLFFFNCRHINFVVHNNLEFAKRSFIHGYMYRKIARSVGLIYLEERLLEKGNLFSNHLNSYLVRHPALPLAVTKSKDLEEKDCVFVSGRNLTDCQLKFICEELEARSIVYCNSDFQFRSDNLHTGYIQDFDQVILNSKRIYLIGDYSYRCSGIFYKAITVKGIEIIIQDLSFLREAELIKIENDFDYNVRRFVKHENK